MDLAKVSNKIKEARIEKGLTQSELARMTNCTQPEIATIESGNKTDITYSKLTALLSAVGLKLAVFPRK